MVDDIVANERFLCSAKGLLEESVEAPAIVEAGRARHAIPGYELHQEIARGGQGVVYRGMQRSTRREAAVKVLLAGVYANESQRRRFEREVELAASLRHPHLVTVYESGLTPGGDRFVAMEYVHGIPIDRFIDESRFAALSDAPECTEFVLRVMGKVALAVAHAHAAGVIHRDLKPSNILIESNGTPRVLDFGVARSVLAQADVAVTQEFVGTPAFAAPEQFGGEGSAVGTRADVYSLGMVLYYLLAGRMAYPCEGAFADVARHARESMPSPPSRWNPRLAPDIDAIVLTCLAKEPERRYESAAELAVDIGNYLDGRPIQARRDNLLYVLRKWGSRHRVAASAACLALLTMAGAAVGFGVLAKGLDSARRDAEAALALSEVERARLLSAGGDVSRAEEVLWRLVAPGRGPGYGNRSSLRAEWALRELYARTGILLSARIDAVPFAVGFGRDESVWVVDGSGARTDWTAEGKLLERVRGPAITGVPYSACASTRGDVVAVSSDLQLVLQRRKSDGIRTLQTNVSTEWASTNVRMSNDGRFLVQWRWSGPEGLRVWDGHTLASSALLEDPAIDVCFDVDREGPLLLVGTRAPHGKVVMRRPPDWRAARRVVVPPELIGPSVLGARHPRLLRGGTELFASLGETVLIWDLQSEAAPVVRYKSMPAAVAGVSTPTVDGRLGVGLLDGTMAVLDTSDLSVVCEVQHNSPVRAVSMDEERGLIGTAYADGSVRVIEAAKRAWLERIQTTPVTHACVALSREGVLAWVDDNGDLHLREATPPHVTTTFHVHAGVATSVDFSPDGLEVLTSGMDGTVRCWRKDGTAVRTIATGLPRVWSAKFSPDGQCVAASCEGNETYVWRGNSASSVLTLQSGADRAPKIAWSPDGRSLATAATRQGAIVWDSENGSQRFSLAGHGAFTRALIYSSDGRLIATGGDDRTVRIWDAETGALLRTVRGLPWGPFDLAFGADMRLLFAVGRSGEVVVLDAQAGEELATLHVQDHSIFSIAVGGDGQHLYVAGQDPWIGVVDLAHLDKYLRGNGGVWERDAGVSEGGHRSDGQR